MLYEAFARAGILLSGKAKMHGKREFIIINDRIEYVFNAARKQNNNCAKVSMIDSVFTNNLTEFLESNPKVNRLCVAYSGGLDSSVLLHLANNFCTEYSNNYQRQISVCALHVNHHISKNSDMWEKHCQEVCESYRCDFLSRSVTIDKKSNIENQAREKRYQFFEEACGDKDVLLMAHHLNDQTETLLFRFFRGSSSKALVGIRQQRYLNPQSLVKIFRPLISVDKVTLEAYAKTNSLSWVEDESNQDKKYARNFIRNLLLPSIREYWPTIDENLARSARFFSETEDLLKDLAELDFRELLNQEPSLLRWGDSLSLENFHHLSLARKKNVLRFWMAGKHIDLPSETRLAELIHFADDLERESAGEVRWKYDDFDAVFRVFEKQLFFHCIAHCTEHCMAPLENEAEREEYLTLDEQVWNLNEQATFDCGGYRYHAKRSTQGTLLLNTAVLSVRFRVGGERCKPLGRSHSQTLKKLFQEYRIPPWERESAPLFYENEKLVAVADFWVCEGAAANGYQEDSLWLIERYRI